MQGTSFLLRAGVSGLVFALAGCGGGGSSSGDANSPSTNPPPASPAPAPPPAAPGQFIVLQLKNGAIYRYDLDSNALMPLEDRRWPSEPVLSPDGNRMAYTVWRDGGIAEGADLYVAATDGTGVTRLTAALPAQSSPHISQFVWSPDSSQVAYRAFLESDGIYLVNADGTNHRKISPAPADPNNPRMLQFSDIKWSANSRYVAYRSVISIGIGIGINVHDVQAGQANGVRIEPVSTPTEDGISKFDWAPDSSRIAYLASVAGVRELYTVRPDTAHNMKVSVPLVAEGTVWRFKWSPDASRILYLADATIPHASDLYTVAPDGTGSVRINAPVMVNNGGVRVIDWSPDASRIAYLQVTGTVVDFYTARPDGTGSVKIDVPVNSYVEVAKWSPDGSRIAYHVALSRNGPWEIHTVRPDGTDNQKLKGVFTLPNISCERYCDNTPASLGSAWSPDGLQLAYTSVQDTASMELFTVRPQTGEYLKLNNPLAANAGLWHSPYGWSHDAKRIAYLADEDGDGVHDLYVTGSNALGNTNVTRSITAADRPVISFFWSPRP